MLLANYNGNTQFPSHVITCEQQFKYQGLYTRLNKIYKKVDCGTL